MINKLIIIILNIKAINYINFYNLQADKPKIGWEINLPL